MISTEAVEDRASVSIHDSVSGRAGSEHAATKTGGRFRRRLHSAGRAGAILLAVAAMILLGRWHLDGRFTAKRWGVVVPGRVFRSGQISRYLAEDMLRDHEIAAVVDLQGLDPTDAHQRFELAVGESLKIDHHRFALSGNGTGDVRMYVNAVETIARCEREGKPVLVHCGAGANRTGGVVAVYRLLVRGESPASVMREMAAYRCAPQDNPKLIAYLNANMAYFAEELAARNVLARVPDEIPQLNP